MGHKPHPQAHSPLKGGGGLQRLPQHRQQGKADGHGDIGLIDAHGQGQQHRPQERPLVPPPGQPHRPRRQQNSQSIGRGGEHIEEGVPQAGEGGHNGPPQSGGHPAPDLQNVHRQCGGQTQQHHGHQADGGGHLGKIVQGRGVVQKPPAGHRHLLGVIHPAQAVGVGDQVGKGKEMGQIAHHKAAEKRGPGRRVHPLPQPGHLLVHGHKSPSIGNFKTVKTGAYCAYFKLL